MVLSQLAMFGNLVKPPEAPFYIRIESGHTLLNLEDLPQAISFHILAFGDSVESAMPLCLSLRIVVRYRHSKMCFRRSRLTW